MRTCIDTIMKSNGTDADVDGVVRTQCWHLLSIQFGARRCTEFAHSTRASPVERRLRSRKRLNSMRARPRPCEVILVAWLTHAQQCPKRARPYRICDAMRATNNDDNAGSTVTRRRCLYRSRGLRTPIVMSISPPVCRCGSHLQEEIESTRAAQ